MIFIDCEYKNSSGWMFLWLIFASQILFTACSNNSSTVDGDLDSELSIEEEIEPEADEEKRERPKTPEGPVGFEPYPKTMWYDEVETGELFTWGFFPRDFYPDIPRENKRVPIVWDNENRRILAIETGEYKTLGENAHFAIYSLTEENSEILDSFQIPLKITSEMRWQGAAAWVYGAVLVGEELVFSFRKYITCSENPQYSVVGLISYNVKNKKTRLLYYQLLNFGETNTVGAIQKVDENTLIIRRDSGFYELNIADNAMTEVPVGCKDSEQYENSCISSLYYKNNGFRAFLAPEPDSPGLAFCNVHILSTANNNGEWDFTASASHDIHDCKVWYEHQDCKSYWLPFERDCCVSSKNIVKYIDDTYILSSTHSTLFVVNRERGENGGLEGIAGTINRLDDVYISPDGIPADEGYLGGVMNWLITDDGDVMYVSPYDYSVRGIKGPLDEWAK